MIIFGPLIFAILAKSKAGESFAIFWTLLLSMLYFSGTIINNKKKINDGLHVSRFAVFLIKTVDLFNNLGEKLEFYFHRLIEFALYAFIIVGVIGLLLLGWKEFVRNFMQILDFMSLYSS